MVGEQWSEWWDVRVLPLNCHPAKIGAKLTIFLCTFGCYKAPRQIGMWQKSFDTFSELQSLRKGLETVGDSTANK